jgi:hypothetical protein
MSKTTDRLDVIERELRNFRSQTNRIRASIITLFRRIERCECEIPDDGGARDLSPADAPPTKTLLQRLPPLDDRAAELMVTGGPVYFCKGEIIPCDATDEILGLEIGSEGRFAVCTREGYERIWHLRSAPDSHSGDW